MTFTWQNGRFKTIQTLRESRLWLDFHLKKLVWLYFVSCKSKNWRKNQIVACGTKYVWPVLYGAPCTFSHLLIKSWVVFFRLISPMLYFVRNAFWNWFYNFALESFWKKMYGITSWNFDSFVFDSPHSELMHFIPTQGASGPLQVLITLIL